MTRLPASWRTGLAAGSLLLLGAVSGVTADRLLHRPASADMLRSDAHHDRIAELDRLLDLRPEQRERVAALLVARQAAIDGMWHETHTRLNATVDSVVNEIAAVLDSAQAARFRTLHDELHGSGHRQRRSH